MLIPVEREPSEKKVLQFFTNDPRYTLIYPAKHTVAARHDAREELDAG